MRTLRSGSRRLPAIILCLAVFLIGGNYCAISAWSGNVRMACLTPPAAKAQAASCSHCAPGHAARGKTAAKPSCCPAPVVTPSAPAIDKQAATAPSSLLLGLVASAELAPPAPIWRGHTAACESPPPTRLAHAPLPARAPPLA